MEKWLRNVYGNYVRYIIIVSAAVLPIIFTAAPALRAAPASQSIESDPLDIYCFDTGEMALYFQDLEEYYSGDNWGSVLMFDSGETTLKFSDSYHKGVYESETSDYEAVSLFTAVTNSKPNDWEIDTVMAAGDTGVTITQKVEYTEGDSYYKMTWTITNTSDTTYTNCKFFHGGDATFGEIDDADSYWNEALGMVYLKNPGVSGLMGFYGGLGSRADKYNGGDYWDGNVMAVEGDLDNIVSTSPEHDIDAGYHLQWNRDDSLGPDESWEITAYEKWTESGDVQVMAPAEQTAGKGDVVSLSFVVQNFQEGTDTFDLSVESALGWGVSLPDGDTVTLDPGETATVTVNVVVPEESELWEDTITLTATSQEGEGITNSDSVKVTVEGEAPADNATRHHGHSGMLCFVSTAETSANAGAALIIGAIFLGLCSLIRRRSA